MEWFKAFEKDIEPSDEAISEFIHNPLWEELNAFLKETYNIKEKKSYSGCSAQPGWNVKYQKSGKSLCTLYPMDGYFIALVVIGNKEMTEAEYLIPTCTSYTQQKFHDVPFYCGGKWLMMEVQDKDILNDVKALIQTRVAPKTK